MAASGQLHHPALFTPITTEYKTKWPTEQVHMLAEEQNLIPPPVVKTWFIHSPASDEYAAYAMQANFK